MSGDVTSPLPLSAPGSPQPGVNSVTPVWNEPSHDVAGDIREFTRLLSSAPAKGDVSTPPAPWLEQLARRVLESDYTDWRLVHTRKGLIWSCARGGGKNAETERLTSSAKASEEPLTRFKSAGTVCVTPAHLRELELRRQVLLPEPELSDRWLPGGPFTDPHWDDASLRLPRLLLELSLESPACRSLMR